MRSSVGLMRSHLLLSGKCKVLAQISTVGLQDVVADVRRDAIEDREDLLLERELRAIMLKEDEALEQLSLGNVPKF